MTKAQFDRLLPLKVPHVIACCPICGDCIYVGELQDWQEDGENGNIAIDEDASVSVTCGTEPDLDSDDWEDWMNGHWSTPYIDWLPITHIVRAWLAREIEKPELLRLLGAK